MSTGTPDLAQVRFENALLLFEEFVRATARHADAATLRGLERRFAERVQIQPSYWSQIKSRSRQIGERLARQFEHLMHKPRGWMDVRHAAPAVAHAGHEGAPPAGAWDAAGGGDSATPRDDDERFIIGLVLTYYRRHPGRARARLLDLLGEVLVPGPAPSMGDVRSQASPAASSGAHATTTTAAAREDDHALWARSQSGVAPLKRKP
jgi:hypothetical protein